MNLVANQPGAIVVLGMQRSGTSCLAGMLAALGAVPPGPVVKNWENPRGYFEAFAAIRLNEAVLAHSGGHWLQPPVRVQWTPDHARERDALLSDPTALLKDPRTLLTLPFWQAGIPQPRWVGIIRHPLAVAHSLLAWRQLPLAEGLALWRAHNAALLRLHARESFPLVDFDLHGPEFIDTVAEAAHHLGLTVDHRRLQDIYASELVHHGGDAELDAETQALHAALRSRCLQPSISDTTHRAASARARFPWPALEDPRLARTAISQAADPGAVIVPLVARLLSQRRAPEALALLQEVTIPADIAGLLLGKTYSALGRHAEAIPHLSHAAASPDAPFEARTLLAHALQRSGRTAEAVAALHATLPQALYPHTIYATLGEWAHETGDSQTAITHLTAACTAAPTRRQGRLLTRLAEMHHAAGNTTHACELLRQAGRIDPTWKRAHALLQHWEGNLSH